MGVMEGSKAQPARLAIVRRRIAFLKALAHPDGHRNTPLERFVPLLFVSRLKERGFSLK